MFTFLFYLLLFFVGYKVLKFFIRSLFLPFDNTVDSQQNFFRNQANGYGFQNNYSRQSNSGEGQVKIYRSNEPAKNPNDRKDVLKDGGDYTDFEEVK